MPRKFVNPRTVPKPMGPYSQAVVATGKTLVFISGQVPEDADGNLVGKNNIVAQTQQVLKNLKAMLDETGATVSDLVKITLFLVGISPSTYDSVAKLRNEFFGSNRPASTLVEVTRLANPDWLIEIEAFAVV